MKTMDFGDLRGEDFSFSALEVFPAVWAERKAFSGYADLPRPSSALFLICTDVRAHFLPDGGNELTAGKGDVVFIPGGICYRAIFEGGHKETPIDTYTVNFRLYDAGGEEILPGDRIRVLASDTTGAFSGLFRNLCDEVNGLSPSPPALKAGFYSLISTLVGSLDRNGDDYYPIRHGVEALCRDWNRNEKIEVYAALSGMSVGYFYARFRKWSGMSPVGYRNRLRLRNAETMLRNTDMPIADIASLVGFDDSFYFCRLFRKTVGLSPRQFRSEGK